MAAKSRVKRSLKTRVKRGAKTPAQKMRAAKTAASKKAAAMKAAAKPAAKRRVKRPEPDSRVVEAALAAFAHEVRTPLTGILAISSLLATSEVGERERRWIDTIRVGAEHLAALATLFVDAARHDSAGLAVRQDFFDLQALSRAMGDSLAGRAAAKGLQPQVGIAAKLPAFVIGDPVRLRA
ncbi:MAG: hybrid sensor histidine kinase/response regulator, partial [Afipia sp.]|nr:hybrid sensor histidine kinase/response regulator [Afipia sp.]